jgi:hypothetical protein
MPLPGAMRTQFVELVQFKAPNGFLSAVAAAAHRDHMSVSEFLRRCAIARLREMGVPIQAVAHSEERAAP